MIVKKIIKKENFLKENYNEVFGFIKKSKNYIYTITILFIASFFIGYFFPVFFSEEIKNFIKDLLERTENLKGFELILFILGNNFLVSFSSIAFGLIFGIMPVITSVVNGYVLGFVAGFAVSQEGILVLWRLFPHGVFELPAIILSLALGLRLGMSFFNKSPKKEFKYCLKNSLRTFVFLIIPLLIMAAIIEGSLIGLMG